MYSLAGVTAGAASLVHFGATRHQLGFDYVGCAAVWAFSIPASHHYRRADQNLSRSVWWYNVAVADSISGR